ncbi:glycoside hydrolase family 43 protein [Leuconostoc gelidum]|uniref:glycoside hydrolase family 43 protein n=1 Tax=Leuconostoc gelidum TaxID=1244 RepID=UPI0002191F54|nr:glycoside hydrolase family 43 protein [Leuconostoc gelidum]AFS40458.1 alpha-N-arabinofuranosidase [Leuconostoc gelidum JB7]MBZ5978397.1 glycoside hydrolase family 43 protein [Leuconostoc gelidum subsp. gelidum]MBZ5992717.1 glycoside hydrolase family 43 protein [Leuconostoc gelidum subsp. gelidum]USP18104.1 glycoside hydrolase family 43 protein [Leuconostoc gelidum subsp. aenigmaticum]GMA68186.1 glycosyl hydrolase [Leuconostoc gelidum subsp. gelidum]
MSNSISYPNPLIIQRADPYIYKHFDGYYYFSASIPAYNLIEIRKSKTISGLAHALPHTIWRKHDSGTGEQSELIWAPEIHYINNTWYIYYAAASTINFDENGMFQHRMYVIECSDEDPLIGEASWIEKGRIQTPIDSFALDATTFEHNKRLYYVWAQKDPKIFGNTNLYISEMENPWTLKTAPVMLTHPEYEWETKIFAVNEGPAILHRNGKFFLTYSGSATDENYCIGMLVCDENSDILDKNSWRKIDHPVFTSDVENSLLGPGHNSFTVSEDDMTDLLVYHIRNYSDIKGDPLYDPNRHTMVQPFSYDEQGYPIFGKPEHFMSN